VNPIGVHAHNPGPMTGKGNWTWLIPGRVPTLIDAGTGEPGHLEELERALAGQTLSQVLVTHAHTDHASGAPVLLQRMPQLQFRKMPWPDRDTAWPAPWIAIGDGDAVEVGDTTLVAIHTPGHAPDHLCFWHEETRTLFCGDLAVIGSTVWIPANLRGDLTAYLASLERVLALDPVRMLPAHGGIIDEPIPLLRRYIQHRHEREQQVIDALRHGAATPEAIVPRVYGTLAETLQRLAQESVLAHLVKLEREGRARRDGEAWHMIEP
jgi:glyoxylase-like metal-dependent hydrolase (beta-lactamase superfamily II)